ncbi:DMT family transporter [Ferrimonas sediminicola]|uniref:DMT family transporter n=1 Tax=Ferrimonas sediminicola TaxID=2569538 RepID=UPI00197AF66B|nr:DMT family transporter [Ferrimonas sediminicola]
MKGRVAECALVFAMMLWASSFIALKLAFVSYDPWTVIAGRMWVATLCFLVMWKRVMRFEYRSGDWKVLLILVLAEPCLYFILEAMALQYTSAGQAGMVTSLAPLLTAVVAFVFLRERLSRIAVMGLSIAIGGVLLLGTDGHGSDAAPDPMLGNALEFGAMLCAAICSVCLKHLSGRYSALTLTALMSFAGLIFFTPLAMIQGNSWHWNSQGIGAIVFLGAFVTLGAYLLYNYAIAHMPVTRAASFVNLIPVFTLVLAYLILGERMTLVQLAACVLVMIGVGVSQMKGRKPLKPPVEQPNQA